MQVKHEDLVEKAQGLSGFPFITDVQVGELFGHEVSQALSFLDQLGAEQGICSSCGGNCCREIKCELYAADFASCPVYDHRPLVCRFHYCQRFGAEHEPLILELRDLCVDAINALPAGSPAWHGIELNLDLYGVCRQSAGPHPELVLEMGRVVEAARRENLSLGEARRILLSMIARADREAASCSGG